MVTQTEQLYQDALRLSDEDRLTLADRLLGSLPDGFQTVVGDDAELHGELLRRAGDREGAVSWDQLLDQLRPSS